VRKNHRFQEKIIVPKNSFDYSPPALKLREKHYEFITRAPGEILLGRDVIEERSAKNFKQGIVGRFPLVLCTNS